MSEATEKPKRESFVVTRDDLRSIVREAWGAGNEARWMQSQWGKGQGAQEILKDVLARLEEQAQ